MMINNLLSKKLSFIVLAISLCMPVQAATKEIAIYLPGVVGIALGTALGASIGYNIAIDTEPIAKQSEIIKTQLIKDKIKHFFNENRTAFCSLIGGFLGCISSSVIYFYSHVAKYAKSNASTELHVQLKVQEEKLKDLYNQTIITEEDLDTATNHLTLTLFNNHNKKIFDTSNFFVFSLFPTHLKDIQKQFNNECDTYVNSIVSDRRKIRMQEQLEREQREEERLRVVQLAEQERQRQQEEQRRRDEEWQRRWRENLARNEELRRERRQQEEQAHLRQFELLNYTTYQQQLPAATQEVLERRTRVQNEFNDGQHNDDPCPICSEVLIQRAPVWGFACEHLLCNGCLPQLYQTSLQRGNGYPVQFVCPLCRAVPSQLTHLNRL